MSSMRADDAGIDHRRADARGIGIDEADDIDAELLPPLEQLARQHDRRRAGADQQQPLARRQALDQPRRTPIARPSPARPRAPPSAGTRPARRPAAGTANRRCRESATSRRSRASAASTRSRFVCDRAQVVEIGVVQAELADHDDQQHAQERRCCRSAAPTPGPPTITMLLMTTAATSSAVSPATSKNERQVLLNMGLLRDLRRSHPNQRLARACGCGRGC